MFPLGGPSQACTPGVQDLEERSIDGERKGAVEQGASPRSGHQNGSELFQDRVEVAPP